MAKPQVFCKKFIDQSSKKVSGISLLETLVVVMVIGVLVAIAAPASSHLISVMNLNTGQDQIVQAIRKAQHNARLSRRVWEFGIRQTVEGQVQWAIYPDQAGENSLTWHDLDPRLKLDAETSLRELRGIRRIQFNHLGAVNGQLGRVTLSIKGGGKTKRCVIISTLLGAIRTGSDQPRRLDGRYCR